MPKPSRKANRRFASQQLQQEHIHFKKRTPYLAQYDKALSRLQLQRALLEQAHQERLKILERERVLLDLINVQECLMKLLLLHKTWLEGADAQEAAATEVQQHPFTAGRGQSTPEQYQQTALRLLAAATPEDVVKALSMDVMDWVLVNRQHFQELVIMNELMQRPSQMHFWPSGGPVPACDSTPAEAGAAPAAGGGCGSAAAAATAIAGGGGQQATDRGAAAGDCGLQPSELGTPVMLQLLQHMVEYDSLVQLALLHGSMSFLKASVLNMVTLQAEQAPAAHWMQAATRLQLTKKQLLHFEVAMEEFRRRDRAISAVGLQCPGAIQSVVSVSSATEQYDQQRQQQQGREHVLSPAALGSSDSREEPTHMGSACSQTATANNQTFAAAAAAATMAGGGPNAGSSSSSMTVAAPSATTAAAGDSTTADAQFIASEALARHAQRKLHGYLHHMHLVSIFLVQTLSPMQQALLLTCSFPYMPMLPTMAEAAVSLHAQGKYRPGDTDAAPADDARAQASSTRGLACPQLLQDIKTHMQQREALLQQQQLRWWQR